MKASYIYRDPRDALLSAMENGQRALQRGSPNAFSPFAEFEGALNFMVQYMRVWEAWMDCKQALLVRYEDLLTDYDAEANRLVEFLSLDGTQNQNQEVIKKYRPEQAQSDQKGLHFSHGKIGRFRQKFNPEQQSILIENFSAYISRMGYPA
jgi:hypothetical protein